MFINVRVLGHSFLCATQAVVLQSGARISKASRKTVRSNTVNIGAEKLCVLYANALAIWLVAAIKQQKSNEKRRRFRLMSLTLRRSSGYSQALTAVVFAVVMYYVSFCLQVHNGCRCVFCSCTDLQFFAFL
jgi:hypothetical protein